MARDYGKRFEAKFKEDFAKIPDSSIDRIFDPVGGYYGIRNVCDFICYRFPFIFYVECKSTLGNTFPLSNLTQYEALLKKKGKKGIHAGVMIWFVEHSRIAWVSIQEFERIKMLGLKSINVKMLGDPQYDILEIPGILKRTFIDADYSVLIDKAEKELQGE